MDRSCASSVAAPATAQPITIATTRAHRWPAGTPHYMCAAACATSPCSVDPARTRQAAAQHRQAIGEVGGTFEAGESLVIAASYEDRRNSPIRVADLRQ
jgi:hypothetical protein